MATVTFSSVSLIYPGGTAGLQDVDLCVADGEFVALVGASGSGKTTLLRALAGFIDPTAGSISIGDRLVADASRSVPPEARHLGMVFQQHAIWPHWSVGRNVEYPLRLARVPRDERRNRVAEVLQLVGLSGLESRNPATLSGGQRQRVALARALVGRPELLLLDEALSALDEPLRDRLRLELRALTTSMGLTVLHVTHDRDEALALADRVVVLDEGRVQQTAEPSELVARPASPAVARFLSDATIFAGVLTAQGFTADSHPCTVATDRVEAMSAGGAQGNLAVLPQDVELSPAESGPAAVGGASGSSSAVVTSSLYGRDGSDVVVTWHGTPVRCHVRGPRPAVGDAVRLSFRRAMFYPTSPVCCPKSPVDTQEPTAAAGQLTRAQ